MRDDKQKGLLVDRLVDTYPILLNDHFPGFGDGVALLLVASLCNVEYRLSNSFSLDDAEQILVCAVNVLVDSNDYDLYEEELTVILVLDSYFREVTKSPYSQKMMPNVGHQTPRICNAIALAMKSIEELDSTCVTAVSEPKYFSTFNRLKALLAMMISLKSGRGK